MVVRVFLLFRKFNESEGALPKLVVECFQSKQDDTPRLRLVCLCQLNVKFLVHSFLEKNKVRLKMTDSSRDDDLLKFSALQKKNEDKAIALRLGFALQ